jgi:hypothetical protein
MNLFNASSLPVSFWTSLADCGGFISSIAFLSMGSLLFPYVMQGSQGSCLDKRQICISLVDAKYGFVHVFECLRKVVEVVLFVFACTDYDVGIGKHVVLHLIF